MQKTLNLRRRTAVCAVAALTVLALLSAVIVTAAEAGHHCQGDDCPICAAVSICRDTLRVLASCAVCVSRSALRTPVTAPMTTGAVSDAVTAISEAVGVRLLN